MAFEKIDVAWFEQQRNSTFVPSNDKFLLLNMERLIKQHNEGLLRYPALLKLKAEIEGWKKLPHYIEDREIHQLYPDVVRRVEELDKLAFSPYREVVCVGYEVDIPMGYKGSRNDVEDLDKRWGEMQRAIAEASRYYNDVVRTSMSWPGSEDDEDQRLKIFVAPEFYFRGARGAYEIDGLPELMEKVRTVTNAYPHWLFVLGTYVSMTRQEEADDVLLQNWALVQKGGYAEADGVHTLLVPKEYPSSIDFTQPDGVPDKPRAWGKPDRQAMLDMGQVKYDDQGKLLEVKASGKSAKHATSQPNSREFTPLRPSVAERSINGCIFAMDGITFGLEVCLDHAYSRLCTAQDYAGVQIQLIPSWGMTIKGGDYIKRGVVFNVDGRPWPMTKYDQSEVMYQGKTQFAPYVSPRNKIECQECFPGGKYRFRYWKPLVIAEA